MHMQWRVVTKTWDGTGRLLNPGYIIRPAIGARARARATRLYWSLLAKQRSLLLLNVLAILDA